MTPEILCQLMKIVMLDEALPSTDELNALQEFARFRREGCLDTAHDVFRDAPDGTPASAIAAEAEGFRREAAVFEALANLYEWEVSRR